MEVAVVLARLNELYHRSQQYSLTGEELAERDRLRRIYLDAIRAQVKTSLEERQNASDCGCHHHH